MADGEHEGKYLVAAGDDERPLAGRVALITGGTGEIGRAAARGLAACGADVALSHRDPEAIQPVHREVERLGVRCHTIHADLSNREHVLTLVPETVAAFGRIDLLINHAGFGGPNNLLDQSDDDWDYIVAVNLTAPFVLSREAARRMIEQGGGGRIVNVGSSSAFRARWAPPAYASAKAGLGGLTRSSAGTLGPHGINVNCVVPGATATASVMRLYPDEAARDGLVREGPMANLLERMSTPTDVADLIVFLCLPQSRQITGQMIHVSAGAVV